MHVDYLLIVRFGDEGGSIMPVVRKSGEKNTRIFVVMTMRRDMKMKMKMKGIRRDRLGFLYRARKEEGKERLPE